MSIQPIYIAAPQLTWMGRVAHTYFHKIGNFVTSIPIQRKSAVFFPLLGFFEEIPALFPFPFQAIIVPHSSFQIGSSVMISFKHEVSREKACNSVAWCDIFIMLQNFEICHTQIFSFRKKLILLDGCIRMAQYPLKEGILGKCLFLYRNKLQNESQGKQKVFMGELVSAFLTLELHSLLSKLHSRVSK